MRLSVLKLIIFYVFRLNTMKKTYIFIATIIICCLFLWIGFYAGWSSKTVTTPTEEDKSDSLFEKQNKCASYYETYKDKLSYVNDSKTSSIDSLSVSYSPSLDNCVASWIIVMDFWDNSMYEFNIVNASRGDQTLYKCYGDPLDDKDRCTIQAWRDYLYDLTYSDIDN